MKKSGILEQKKQSIDLESILSIGMSILLVAFFLIGIIAGDNTKYIKKIITSGWNQEFLLPFIVTYIFICFLLFYNRKFIFGLNDFSLCLFVFFIALIPRMILTLSTTYYPTSDFNSYMIMGRSILERDFQTVNNIVLRYKIPSFGGQAVLNSLLMRIFSNSLFGMQLTHSVITSLSSVAILKIGKTFDKSVGVIAAIIFAFYPSNIIFSQVNTNQHGAVLFFLLAIYMLMVSCDKELNIAIIYSILAAIFINIGYFFHPSKISHLIAVCIYFTVLLIKSTINKDKDSIIKYISVLAVFILLQYIIEVISISLLVHLGIIKSGITPFFIGKIVVGLNPDTLGRYSSEDAALFQGLSSQESFALAIEMIKERIRSINLIEFISKKVNLMWFSMDSSFYWFEQGVKANIDRLTDNTVLYEVATYNFDKLSKIITAQRLLDSLFCTIAYLFAAVGLVFRFSSVSHRKFDLLKWCLLGWIGVHIISEIQARYRYFGMPIIFIFSALGIFKVFNYINGKKIIKRNHKAELIEKINC